MQIFIKDETLFGETIHSKQMTFENEELTVEELIKKRVEQEVENYNLQDNPSFKGLVTPNKLEQVINSVTKQKSAKKIDAEKQVYKALDAFTKNGFLLLFNGEQATELQQKITLKKDMEVSFIKLTPLIGG